MMTTRDDSNPAPLLDLERLVAGIRWRRHKWMSFALIGMLAGALLAILMPPQPTAVTTLLIVHENDNPSDGGNLMTTDIALLQTARIAGAAIASMPADARPESLLGSYEGVGLSSNVMQITVTAPSQRDAHLRSEALAKAFIDDHVRRTQDAVDADARAVLLRRDEAQQDLAKVDDAIAAASARDSGTNPTSIDTLYTRRAALTDQIQGLTVQAEEIGIGTPRVAAGTQIVDRPRAVGQSVVTTAAMNAAIGLVLGLAAGLALAAVASVVADRPVLRREIAEHLGASIIAQIPAGRRGSARLLRRSKSVLARKRVAAGLARIIRNGQGTISLLELGAADATAKLATDIAEKLGTDPVLITADPPGRHLKRTAKRAVGPIRLVDVADDLPPASPETLRIGVGSVRPGTAWPDVPELGAETVLVVRAGHSNALWLHTVARQLAAAGVPIIGVVLVSPDPRDRSDGTLWNGLRTALRGRSVAAVRTTTDLQLSAREESRSHGVVTVAANTHRDNGSERATATTPAPAVPADVEVP